MGDLQTEAGASKAVIPSSLTRSLHVRSGIAGLSEALSQIGSAVHRPRKPMTPATPATPCTVSPVKQSRVLEDPPPINAQSSRRFAKMLKQKEAALDVLYNLEWSPTPSANRQAACVIF